MNAIQASRGQMRAKYTPYVVFALGLLAFSVALPRYAARHFVPEQMLGALGSAHPEVVLLGNSLIVAGYRNELRNLSQPVIFNAGIGATGPLEHFLTLRRILASTQPRTLVYGWFGTQLLDTPVRVDELQGNRLIGILWAHPSDMGSIFPTPMHYPTDVTRFFLMNELPLSGYGPLIQGRIEISRRALAKRGSERTTGANRFGADEDFQKFADAGWNEIESALESHRTGSSFAFSRHVIAMRDLAHARGVKVIWVAMPVASRGRAAAARSKLYPSYVEAIRRDLASSPDAFLDATELEGIDDSAFRDGLHLDDKGAEIFTHWLERRLLSE